MCHQALIFFLFFYAYTALIDDLGGKERPDLLSFVPYKWTVGVKLDNFRMLWMCNPYNWLDCSPSKVAAAENGEP